MNKLRGSIRIQELRTNSHDLSLLIPAGTIPSSISVPESIRLTGTLTGSMANAKANLNLQTNLGSAGIDGTINNATDKIKATYSARINTRNIQLGKILKNDTLYGPLTLNMVVSGRGMDPKTMNAEWKATVQSVVYNRYTYNSLTLNGTYSDQQLKAFASIQDPNISLALNAEA